MFPPPDPPPYSGSPCPLIKKSCHCRRGPCLSSNLRTPFADFRYRKIAAGKIACIFKVKNKNYMNINQINTIIIAWSITSLWIHFHAPFVAIVILYFASKSSAVFWNFSKDCWERSHDGGGYMETLQKCHVFFPKVIEIVHITYTYMAWECENIFFTKV